MKKRMIALLLCVLSLMLLLGCSVPEESRFINPTESYSWEPTNPSADSESHPPADKATEPPPTKAETPRLTARQLAEELETPDLVAQLFLVKCPSGGAETLLREYHVGGVILDDTDLNGESPESLKRKLNGWQELSPIPLIVAVNEEGGNVAPLSSREEFRRKAFDAPRNIYYEGGQSFIREMEAEKAQLLKRCGINVNLAPVCDVASSESAYIADRALFQTPKTTGKVVEVMVKTMQNNGVGAVLKHFPGYGDITESPHKGEVIDNRLIEHFKEYDFVPFQHGIDAGAGAVLVAHFSNRNLDHAIPVNPASLSKDVHTILRSDLGFNGVIMTDDLQMSAIADYYAPGRAAVLAIEAGNDMIITAWSEEVYDTICDAVGTNISREQLVDSVTRIIQWKMDLGLL